MRCCAIVLVIALFSGVSLAADTPAEKLDQLAKDLPSTAYLSSAVGVTRQQTPIPCLLGRDDLDHRTKRTRILLVGGLDGSMASVRNTLDALQWFAGAEAKALRSATHSVVEMRRGLLRVRDGVKLVHKPDA